MSAGRKINIEYYLPLLDEFQRLLKERFKESLISIVLYGSVARGDARADSDIDLLVVVEDEFPDADSAVSKARSDIQEHAVIESYKDPVYHLPPMLSCLTLTRTKASWNRWLYLDMTQEAVFLFDRDGFFKKRLNLVKKSMKRLGSKKVVLPDGSWYWNLKPDLKLGEAFEL